MMKKITLVILAIMVNTIANAQFFRSSIDFYEYDYTMFSNRLYSIPSYQKNNVKQVDMKTLDPKTNSVKRSISYLINKNGVRYQYNYFNKKGVLTSSYYYHLIDSFKYDKAFSVYKKDTFLTLNKFDDKGLLLEVSYYNKKHELTSIGKYSYNEKGKIINNTWLNKKGKETIKYEYKYFENGSREESRYYRNGKLKKVYNYTCEPTGVVEKKVTQQNICKKRTYNADSSYIEIYEGHDNKGNTSRRIAKFSKDSLEIEDIYFDKNDKETRKYIYTYENKNIKTVATFRKGKLKNTVNYGYTPTGLTNSYQMYNAKGKLKFNRVYEYQYF